jgi:hypothetical protein
MAFVVSECNFNVIYYINYFELFCKVSSTKRPGLKRKINEAF